MSVPTSAVIQDETEAEIMLSIDDALVQMVVGGRQHPIEGKFELKVTGVGANNVAPASLTRLGIKGAHAETLVFIGFDPGDGHPCEYHLLTKSTIILKQNVKVFKYMYTIVLPGGKFLEFRLPAASLDGDDLEELEESIEVLDVLLTQHACLRDRGGNVHRRAQVALTENGQLLQKGIGDELGSTIRRAAHFVAKRIVQYQEVLYPLAQEGVQPLVNALPGCDPGTQLRLHQSAVDNLRRAAIIIDNASNQGRQGVSFMIREVSRKVGVACAEDVLESDIGQTIMQHRGIKEVRKVVLAALSAYEELTEALVGVPRKVMQAIFGAMLVVIEHLWGTRAMGMSKYSFQMLTEMLATKYEVERATPANCAMHTFRHMIMTICDEPSEEVCQRIERRRVRECREAGDRKLLLQKLGRPQRPASAPSKVT